MKFNMAMIRPKRILIASATIIIAIILAIIVWYEVSLRPVSTSDRPQIFTVEKGQNAPIIAKNLLAAKLIRSSVAFEIYVNLHGLRPKLLAGVYALEPKNSTKSIAKSISGGATLQKKLTLPEGLTIKQIKQLAVAQGISNESFETALNSSYDNIILASKPADVSLEGYLFPDTYTLNEQETASQLISKMIANTNDKISDDIKQGFAAEGLSLHQGLTLASMVEKEVSNQADRPVVAGVFLNRIKAGQGMQSDVTVSYAAEIAGSNFNLNLDSPYNTYRIKGLPVGPICNPGLSALQAAAHATSTSYYYFLAGRDGKTYFANSYVEHQRNVQKYLK